MYTIRGFATIFIAVLLLGLAPQAFAGHGGGSAHEAAVIEGMNAASPYHIGNTGAFEYPSYLFDALMNLE